MLSNSGVLLRVPGRAIKWNQSILKEIHPVYSLEGLMLKLKLQYFGHLMWRANSLEKTLVLGKIEGRRRRGWQRMRWLDGIIDPMGMSLGRLLEIVREKKAWWGAVQGVANSGTQVTERQNEAYSTRWHCSVSEEGFFKNLFCGQAKKGPWRFWDSFCFNIYFKRWCGK